jgi:hypothetical protein
MNRAEIPRDVQEMPRNQLELEIVRLRTLMGAAWFGTTLGSLLTTLQQTRENLTATQKRCTELLEENRTLKACAIFPGWECAVCCAFNGEAKETRTHCRACNAEGPRINAADWGSHGEQAPQYVGSAVVESTFR